MRDIKWPLDIEIVTAVVELRLLDRIYNVSDHGTRRVSACSSIGVSILSPPVSGRART
jgi:hypothetical protein